jgi:LSD1 subclass zinc finger protein
MRNAEIKDETLKAFNCSNCGAGLKYKPGEENLTCEYCKTVNSIPQQEIIIEETNFEEYLEKLEAENLVNEKTMHCKSCGAVSTVNVNSRSSSCPYCSNPFTDGDAKMDLVIKPSYLLPFKVDKEKAIQIGLNWIKDVWYTKNTQSSSLTIEAVYTPYWTFDMNTHTDSILKNAFNRSFSSVTTLFYDDVLVSASANISQYLLNQIKPWDIQKLTDTNNEYLNDYTVEKYSIDLKKGFHEAKKMVDQAVKTKITSDAVNKMFHADIIQTQYLNIKFKLIIFPVYIISYDYKGKKNQLYVNGYDGKLASERPRNPIVAVFLKTILVSTIIFAALILLLMIASLFALFQTP